MRLHPARPDRLYQQNHCGIYRMERPEGRWERIGRAMPTDIGDIGFPIELHPRDPDTAWVFPMDGTDVGQRRRGGLVAVHRTAPARDLLAGMRVRVRIPTPLRSYTAAAEVTADGVTVDDLLTDLDSQYPGIRFRMVDEQGRLRTHMKVFVDDELTRDLSTRLAGAQEVTLMQALSGG